MTRWTWPCKGQGEELSREGVKLGHKLQHGNELGTCGTKERPMWLKVIRQGRKWYQKIGEGDRDPSQRALQA